MVSGNDDGCRQHEDSAEQWQQSGVGGITSWMPFPKEQEYYVMRTPTVAYSSLWSTPEQQMTQYSSEVTKYAKLLPDTPMIDWKGRKGTYRIAPPYTLVVPAAYQRP